MLLGPETVNSVIAPMVVIRPMAFCSVNQTFPSGPAAMLLGRLPGVGSGYRKIVKSGVAPGGFSAALELMTNAAAAMQVNEAQYRMIFARVFIKP